MLDTEYHSLMLPALDALADGAETNISHLARRLKRNVLNDGAELARPMVRYGVDVRTPALHEIRRIGADDFDCEGL